MASRLWASESSEVQFGDLPKSSDTCTGFIQTIWTLKNADMGLLRTDTLVRFPLVSVSFYARNATKKAFVLGLSCLGVFLTWELKWSQKHHTGAQTYTEAKCSRELTKTHQGLSEFLSVCVCLCMHAYAHNLFFSLYLLAHSEWILLQLILSSPQRLEGSHLVPQPQQAALWNFFTNHQESSPFRNCFQHLVASKSEGNHGHPGLS